METVENRRAAARLRTALDMHDFGVEFYRQRLRRDSPDATEEEIRRDLLRWLWDLPRGVDPS
jgi:hypothetical protein